MRLTRYTDYALRVLMYLGGRPGRTGTISEIAERYRISRNHLLKVVHGLAHTGYLITRRGKGGGLQLARPAAQINLGEVVRRMEGSLAVVECMGEDHPANCLLDPCCALKGAVADARAAFLTALDRYTLADLVNPAVSQRLHPADRTRADP
ncbi:HTH-type transcriptional repressor NsrR [bacterium BMS3Bbin12]|nr:HTH-type transcriptional repressor NsrR [bacterium BMS3Abin12]GBE47311.1 HTH-type transcriptional repressor NsrR [bacterium BMS3Bbin12]GBE50702.1 HTH-type transcriptional repressor NsrR [bacterium BMS3Bbin13]HDK02994.1 Rrf2 family transcriptional regulator [Gammaproteobacteria bacterium]HDO34187.1 Rrf2 family transcriptional regulator [Chromatiales bacterium]